MTSNASQQAIDRVVAEIERMGSQAHLSRGQFRTVIGAVGEEGSRRSDHLAALDGVEKVVPIMKPYKLASREFHEEDSVIEVGGGKVPTVKVGGPHAACIAGPCAVENETDALNASPGMCATAARPSFAAACISRDTSPYSFQGLGHRSAAMDARRAAMSWACRSASK